MFKITPDVVSTLNNFIKAFKTKGLAHIQGGNVFVVTKEMLRVCMSVAKVNALPNKAPVHILMGLCLSVAAHSGAN